MGQRTFVIGETPAQANLLKLTGNFLITCVIESLAEAFALTTKGGIETSKVYELLTETLFAAPVYKTYDADVKDRISAITPMVPRRVEAADLGRDIGLESRRCRG